MSSVFIFGAGASKQAGIPLMKEFLDVAETLAFPSGDAAQDLHEVQDALSELQRVQAKSYLDYDNIETLFGAVEMAAILQKFPGRAPEQIERLRRAIVSVIVTTVERSAKIEINNNDWLIPQPYGQLIEGIPAKTALTPKPTFITFNYDILFELAMHRLGWTFSYGLNGEPAVPHISRYLKLHGSINWGTCPECGRIIPYNVGDAQFPHSRMLKSVYYDLGSKISTRRHCNSQLAGPPVIVPPTWSKTQYHDKISPVWKAAAEALAGARNIFIIGYSFPESDSFFRFLLSLGLESTTRVRRFWVFNPDSTLEARFRNLLGGSTKDRFAFHEMRFDQAIPIISNALESES